MDFFSLLLASLTAVLFENIIFSKALGTSTMLVFAKYPRNVLEFGLTITYFCLLTGAVSYPFSVYLGKNDISYLYMPLIYVLCVGFIYALTLILLWKLFPKLFLRLKKYIHLSSFNCAVIGVPFIASAQAGFARYMATALATGLGFMLATYLMSINYSRFSSEEISKSFRGFPSAMIYIGIISMLMFVFQRTV